MKKDSLKNQIEVLKCNNGVLRERLSVQKRRLDKLTEYLQKKGLSLKEINEIMDLKGEILL